MGRKSLGFQGRSPWLAFVCSEVWSFATLFSGVGRLTVNPPAVALSLALVGSGLLPSTGVTQLHRYYEPIRHPPSPALVLTDSRLARKSLPCHGSGLPLLHIFHLPCVPPSLPRWNHKLRISLASPATSAFLVIMANRLPHLLFSEPAQRSLALRPAGTTDSRYGAFSQSASDHSLPPDPP